MGVVAVRLALNGYACLWFVGCGELRLLGGVEASRFDLFGCTRSRVGAWVRVSLCPLSTFGCSIRAVGGDVAESCSNRPLRSPTSLPSALVSRSVGLQGCCSRVRYYAATDWCYARQGRSHS